MDVMNDAPPACFEAAMAARGAFRLGCQGPDFFFFHNMLSKTKSQHAIGNMLHERNIDLVMRELCRQAGQDEAALAYVMGFLCHYALDYNAHPYIYSKVCHDDHTRFEAGIDSAYLRHRGVDIAKLPPSRVTAVTDDVLRRVDSVVSAVVKAAFNKEISGVFFSAVKQAAHIQRAGFDPYDLKRPLAKLLDAIIGQPQVVSGKLFRRDTKDEVDYLNLKRMSWKAPWEDKLNSESFLDIMQTAKGHAIRMWEALMAALSGGNEALALEVIGARSFATGIEWSQSPEFEPSYCVYCRTV